MIFIVLFWILLLELLIPMVGLWLHDNCKTFEKPELLDRVLEMEFTRE